MWVSLRCPKPLLPRQHAESSRGLCSGSASCTPRTVILTPRSCARGPLTIRCEYSHRPQQQQQQQQQPVGQPTGYAQQPWQGSYDYPPPPSSARPPPGQPPPGGPGRGPGGGGNGGGMNNLTKAFIAGAFILGMGAGIMFDYEVSFEPQNVASTVLVDTKTPNSEVCMANGYSSMVFDQRIFVSFNPFNVYVSQPEVKPGCVLRRSNVNVLESRSLVTSQEVQACKRNMNTFAFVGNLNENPEVSCVYHSEEAENQFLKDPKRAKLGDGYAPPPAAQE